jgi:drug/metabolite transporter (DMT)-like permease
VRGARAKGVALVVSAAVLWGGWALARRPAGLPPLQSAFTVLLVMAAPLPFTLEPLTAAVVGWAAFGEAVGPAGLAGAALVLASGVAVALEREPPRAAATAP